MTLNSLIYLFGGVLSAISPYVILSYIAKNLSVEQVGYLALFQTIILMISSLVNLNTSSAIERYYYSADENRNQFVVFSFATASFIFLTLLLAVFIASQLLSNIIDIKNQHIFIAIILGYLSYIYTLKLLLYQINFEPIKYVILQLLNAVLPLLSFFGILYLNDNIFDNRIASLIISISLVATISVVSLYRKDIKKLTVIKQSTITKVLSYSTPLIFNLLLNLANLLVLRFLVNYYTDLSITGVFMATFQVSMLASFVVDAINKSYSPYAIRSLTSKKLSDLSNLRKLQKILICVAFFGLVLAYISSNLLVEFVLGAKYNDNGNTLFILLLSHIFQGISYIFLPYILIKNQTLLVSIANFISCLFLVLSIFTVSTDLDVVLVAKIYALHKFIYLLLILYFVKIKLGTTKVGF